jgi:hypothetical protein
MLYAVLCLKRKLLKIDVAIPTNENLCIKQAYYFLDKPFDPSDKPGAQLL